MEQWKCEAKDVLELLLNLVQRRALFVWHLLVDLMRHPRIKA